LRIEKFELSGAGRNRARARTPESPIPAKPAWLPAAGHDGRSGWLIPLTWLLLAAPLTLADKVILRDGQEIEGSILEQTEDRIVVMTSEGKRVYRMTRVREVIREDAAAGASAGAVGQDFEALSPLAQELANAQAEYVLGRYDAVVKRLPAILADGADAPERGSSGSDNSSAHATAVPNPHASLASGLHSGQETGSTGLRRQAQWLLIESYERLAQFDKAEELLKQIQKNGDEPNRIRATAHLDLFEQNPGYKLERVNTTLSRKFLPRDLYLKGKERNALADGVLMRKALEEYADQILLNKKVSLKAFQEQLNLDETLQALRDMPSAGQVQKYLPYHEHLDEVEKSIAKADAVLPGYAAGYELDLIRSEAEHVRQAIEKLFAEVFEDYPENQAYEFDPLNGKLTKSGREAWRANCDEFLAKTKPVVAVGEYLLSRTARYPRQLERTNTGLRSIMDRLNRTREAITRKKDTRTDV